MGEHATYIISCRRDVLFLSIDVQELFFHSVSMMCCDLLLNYVIVISVLRNIIHLFSLKNSFCEDIGISFLSKYT